MTSHCGSRIPSFVLCVTLGALGAAGCGATAVVGPGAVPDASVATDDTPVATVDTPVTPPVDVPVAPPIDVPISRRDVPPTMPVDVPRPRLDVPMPVTTCGPENDGRACGIPGQTCATVGGDECTSHYACRCGLDRRWSCSTSMPVDCDAGTVEPSDAATPVTCTFAGRYTAAIEDATLWFDFSPEGLWRAAMDEASLASPVIAGTYSVMGTTLVLTGETREGGGGGSCEVTDRGTYLTRFSADCASMRLELRSEDCEERGSTLQRMTFSRR